METRREFHVENEKAWADIVPLLIQAAQGKKIWLLEGDLGSGKTTLARYLIHYLGGPDDVNSPTFSLVNEYEWSVGEQSYKLFHLDLYRLETVEEVIDIGFEEFMDDDAYVLIEWPDIAAGLLPDDCFKLEISHEDSHRKVLVL